jgi:hypothetical protein
MCVAATGCRDPKIFPGAQGFGTDSPAGRGGQVVKVTNLNDSGPGSLRDAIEIAGPRIIVFEVGGEIHLTSGELIISEPFVTIAGQSAPAPGITIMNGGLDVRTHDVLVQHMRIRPGDNASDNSDPIQIFGTNAYNVVFDHCTASWAKDEGVVIYGGAHDITVSNTIVSDQLNAGFNISHGMLIGHNSRNISILGVLLANNRVRNPYIQENVSIIFANNVIYNIGNSKFITVTTHGDNPPPSYGTIEGNIFIAGPLTSGASAIGGGSDVNSATEIFLQDNSYTGGISDISAWLVKQRPVWIDGLKLLHSSKVESSVLSSSGARPSDRDAIDQRVVYEVVSRNLGKHPNCVEQQVLQKDCDETPEYLYTTGETPVLGNSARPFEAVNPHDDANGDGYTNIEEVLHQMAIKLEISTAVE